MKILLITFLFLNNCSSQSADLAFMMPTFENEKIGKGRLAVDGKNRSCAMVGISENTRSTTPWWTVQLDRIYFIKSLIIAYTPIHSKDDLLTENFVIFASVNSYKHLIQCATVLNKISRLSVDSVNVTCNDNVYGNLVHIVKSAGPNSNMMSLCEVNVFGEANTDTITLTYKRPTEQSGLIYANLSPLAVDGKLETCTRVRDHTGGKAWWRVTLDDIYAISNLVIYFNPRDYDAMHMDNFDVYISNDQDILKQQLCRSIFGNGAPKGLDGYLNISCDQIVVGRYVTIIKTGGADRKSLFLCEVFAYPQPDESECINGDLKCPTSSECIPKIKICDRVRQCPDGTDELNCACLSYQYKCSKGFCIHTDWLCDGTKDCPDGDDEALSICLCKSSQFKCLKNKVCIDKVKRCDGFIDCPDSSDEFHCLELEKGYIDTPDFVKAIFQGEGDFYICNTYWTASISFKACEHMGRGLLRTTMFSPLQAKKILDVKSFSHTLKELTPIMDLFEKRNSCRTGQFIQLACYGNMVNHACGVRGYPDYPEAALTYIINGDVAHRGAWPWHVQLIMKERSACGGSIINYYWILTTAHCLYDLSNASEVTVKYGTNLRNDPGVINRPVTRIVLHPNFTDFFNLNDVALLKLKRPIMFDVFTKPICLPEKYYNDTKLKSFRYCIISGYGSIDRAYGTRKPEQLRQGRLDLLTNEECLRNLRNDTDDDYEGYIATNKIVCAGSIPTTFGTNSCRGDSGGPLVCKNENGRWTQIGIMMSYYKGRIAEHCSNSIFTRVSEHLDFIKSVISN